MLQWLLNVIAILYDHLINFLILYYDILAVVALIRMPVIDLTCSG